MTGILGHIGEFSKYLILHRMFWWGMSLPPLFLLSIVNADLWGFFSDPVFYRGTVTEAGLMRPQGDLYLVEMSLVAVSVCRFGRFCSTESMECLAGAGPRGPILACRIEPQMVFGLWLP